MECEENEWSTLAVEETLSAKCLNTVWIRQLKLLSLKQNVCSPWNRFQLSEVDLFEKVGIPVSFPARYRT